MRNDSKPAIEGNDFHYTTGGTEPYCRQKCNDAQTCSAFEFDAKKTSCKHWLGSVKGNYTDYNKTEVIAGKN